MRRVVIVSIKPDFLVELFNAVAQRPAAVRVPYFGKLPLDGDLKCEAVHYNYERQCFDVLFNHSTFAEVPDGDLLPRIGCEWAQWTALPEYQSSSSSSSSSSLPPIGAERTRTRGDICAAIDSADPDKELPGDWSHVRSLKYWQSNDGLDADVAPTAVVGP